MRDGVFLSDAEGGSGANARGEYGDVGESEDSNEGEEKDWRYESR